MDHLPSPRDATYTPPKSPLVCEKLDNGRYWDGGIFLEYPSRAGDTFKHFVLPDELSYRYHFREENSPTPTDLLESFLQRWLWFGMLHEAFSEDDLYNEDHWVETIDGTSFVTSKTLPQVLESYALIVGTLDLEEKHRRCQHLHSLLRRYFCMLRVIRADSSSHKTFNAAIRASLISLYDHFASAWDKLYDDVSGSLPWTPAMGAYGTFTTDEVDIMKSNGWCPALIHSESKEDNSPSLRRYLSQLKQYPEADHSACSDVSCRLETTDNDYQPQHAIKGCTCRMIGPELAAVEAVLRTGNYPVLRVTGEDISSVQIDILPHDPSRAYVAISHVWAQGLGNPSALVLPACQVLRMQKTVNALEGRSFVWPVDMTEEEKGPLYLWCDSLLCPTVAELPEESSPKEKKTFSEREDIKHQARMKQASLRHLKKVYVEAKYVLVLDKGLEQIAHAEVSAVEAAARLLTSQWAQRLWTYQEAALPIKLLVKFQDAIVDYRVMVLAVRSLYQSDIALRPLHFPLLNRMIQLRALQYLPKERRNDLLAFSNSFGRRRFKMREDGPLCAGALLGLDTGEIAEAIGTRQRMAVFWQLFARENPALGNLIFLDIPRLHDIPGMRWAPSSFSEQLGRLTDHLPSKLTVKGLKVKLSSWRIKLNALPWVPNGFLLQGLAESLAMIWMHNPANDQWYKVTIPGEGDQINKFWRRLVTTARDKPQEWRIVFESSPKDRGMVRGLLCLVERGQANFPILHSGVTLDV